MDTQLLRRIASDSRVAIKSVLLVRGMLEDFLGG